MKRNNFPQKIKGALQDLFLHKEKMILLVLTGILLFVICLPTKSTSYLNDDDGTGWMSGSGKGQTQETQAGSTYMEEDMEQYVSSLEERLREQLCVMDGVGEVSVMITLQKSAKQIIAREEPVQRSDTTQTDSGGSTRTTQEYQKEDTAIYTKQSGTEIPFVLQQELPEIEGVLIVAEGGGDGQIQFQITESVQALFGIEPHKIKIVKRKS